MSKKSAEVENEKKESQQSHFDVDVTNIKPLERAGGNIRTDYGKTDGSFKELVKSIEQNGILVPLRAYRDKENPGHWIAIDGHRRLDAAMHIVKESGSTIRVKVIVVDSRTITDEQLVIDMVVTNSGKALSPIELSEAVRRLLIYKFSTKEIASKFGMTEHAIKNLEWLTLAPKRIRDLITANRLSYSTALDFLKTSKDFNEAIELIEKAFSVASVEKQTAGSVNENGEQKISRKHLKEVGNKVDSVFELKKVFKSLIDNQKEVKNQELYTFAKKLVENKLTASDIDKLLF